MDWGCPKAWGELYLPPQDPQSAEDAPASLLNPFPVSPEHFPPQPPGKSHRRRGVGVILAGFAPPRLPSRREGSGCGDALVRAPGSVVGVSIGGDPDKVRGWVEKLQNTRKNK